MLISYSKKFIFIHVYKVGGSSVRKALEEFAPNPQQHIVNRIMRKLGTEPPYYKWKSFPPHIKAREAKDQLPKKVYNNFFKFTFVRNPWDWQVSLYHYMIQEASHFQHDLIKRIRNFDDYIDWRINEDKHLQKDFVTDHNGNVIVDFIGKLENIEEDFSQVCNILSIDANLPHVNISFHRDYRSYYNDKTTKLIEDHFKEDIDFFGYSFNNR